MLHVLKKERLSRDLYAIRGIAIALVVLGHLIGNVPTEGLHRLYGPDIGLLTEIAQVFYTFHVPLFFIASGISYALLRTKEVGAWPFLKSRFFRLIVPLWCFAPVAYIFRASMRHLPWSWGEVLIESIVHRFNIFWFLYALFFTSVLAYFSFKVIRSRFMYFIGSVLFAFAALVLSVCYPNSPWQDVLLYLYWNLFYALGLWVADWIGSLEKLDEGLKHFPWWAISLLLLTGPYVVSMVNGIIPGQYYLVTKLFNGPIAFAYLIVFLAALPRVSFLEKMRGWIEVMGRLSMPIYLIHIYFLILVRIAVDKVLGATGVAMVLHLVLGSLIAIWGPILIYQWLKPRSKIFSFILGEPPDPAPLTRVRPITASSVNVL